MEILEMKGIFCADEEYHRPRGDSQSWGTCVQAVFAPFLIADGDAADGVRTGGFGSTGH